jgi:hypothetical protein
MRVLSITLFAIVLLSSVPLYAQEAPSDPVLKEKGWELLTFEKKKPNLFQHAGDETVRIVSENAVSLLYRKVDLDLAQTPNLTWSWKVDQAVSPTDLSVKGKDDRSVALYISFPFDKERAGFWEKFIRSLVVAFKGEDTPGRVLTYVWGGDVERGQIIESPYLKSAGGMIILRGARDETGVWYDETVNIAEDYERIFGVPANQPYQIAISADTDDTKEKSDALVRNIRFAP